MSYKKNKVCFISPYPKLTVSLKHIFRSGDRPLIMEGAIKDAERIASNIRHAVDVIVTTEGNARHLADKIDIPLVMLLKSPFDILRSLSRAKKECERDIALFEFRVPNPKVPAFREVLEHDIDEVIYYDIEDAMQKLRRLEKEGCRAVVSGGLIANLIEKEKIKIRSFPVYPGKDEIMNAYSQAQQIVMVCKRERYEGAQLKSILESIFDGLIVVDTQGRVTLINSVCRHLLNLQREKVIGSSINEILPEKILPPVLKTGEEFKDFVKDISGRRLIINGMPIYNDKILSGAIFVLQEADRIQHLDRQIRTYNRSQGHKAYAEFSNIIGVSEKIKDTIEKAKLFAKSEECVLITGETGTGKELFAQSIHNESTRRNGPFVAVNCAAIPPSLLESELFGYREGAFTGAKRGGKPGFFQLAHGGTLFLDEVGELSIEAQSRFLRVLQEKQVMPVGDAHTISVDVRIIAATNQPLETRISEGLLREDFYYRLNILPLEIPPLRERPEDILPIAEGLIERLCKDSKVKMRVVKIINQYSNELKSHLWPGNVRELENYIKRVICLLQANGNKIPQANIARLTQETRLNNYTMAEQLFQNQDDFKTVIKNLESYFLSDVLKNTQYKKTEIAKMLGMSRTTLYRKLKRFS